jgi:hypothetical protein
LRKETRRCIPAPRPKIFTGMPAPDKHIRKQIGSSVHTQREDLRRVSNSKSDEVTILPHTSTRQVLYQGSWDRHAKF